MAIQDHVAILLAGSLDRAAPNRKKPHAAPRYYVRAAFPPDAAGDLAADMASIAPGGNWQALSHNIKPNRALAKPYPGIPDDYLIVKMDTQFPVAVYGENGQAIPVSAENSPLIRTQFYSGQRIRLEGAPYTWNNDGEHGISWNLYGALAVGGGERRNVGSGDGFAAYRKDAPPPTGAFGTNSPGAQSNGFGGQEALAAARGAPTNAFQAAPASATAQNTAPANTTQANGNPFQQSGGNQAANPFG